MGTGLDLNSEGTLGKVGFIIKLKIIFPADKCIILFVEIFKHNTSIDMLIGLTWNKREFNCYKNIYIFLKIERKFES